MSDIRLGNPAIPIQVTEHGTCVARLEDIWQGARRYAEIRGYKVIEDYGVMGVAPFIPKRAKTWLGYLQVPFDEPVRVYQQFDRHAVWVAEWSVS